MRCAGCPKVERTRRGQEHFRSGAPIPYPRGRVRGDPRNSSPPLRSRSDDAREERRRNAMRRISCILRECDLAVLRPAAVCGGGQWVGDGGGGVVHAGPFGQCGCAVARAGRPRRPSDIAAAGALNALDITGDARQRSGSGRPGRAARTGRAAGTLRSVRFDGLRDEPDDRDLPGSDHGAGDRGGHRRHQPQRRWGTPAYDLGRLPGTRRARLSGRCAGKPSRPPAGRPRFLMEPGQGLGRPGPGGTGGVG